MTNKQFLERLEEIVQRYEKDSFRYGNLETFSITRPRMIGSLITLFEDYTKQIVGDYEITEENQDNGHDCYEKFCDYCDKGTRDDLRITINQTSQVILRDEPCS